MGINIQNKSICTLLGIVFWYTAILVSLFSFTILPGVAQSNFNGVLQNYLASQTTGEHEFITARNRLKLQFEKPTDFGGITAELDLIQNLKEVQNLDFLLKEAYFDWYLDRYDLRIGHQKIMWGRTNGAFITDIITPVDLREFLTISAEDIRFGITSFNAIRYFGANSIQLVAVPFFQPDLLPSSDSRWFPAQQITSTLSPVPINTRRKDSSYQLKDIQVALRYSLFSPQYLDLDFFLMRWTHPSPAYDISFSVNDIISVDLIESYQNSWMAGFSTSAKISPSFFILMETLFVKDKLLTTVPFSQNIQPDLLADPARFSDLLQSFEFAEGDFLTSKPWLHSMAGLRTEFLKTTMSAQFFIEGIFDYEGQIIQEEMYMYITFLANRSFLRDRLRLFTLSRYNIDTEDFWIQFQGQYELDDNLQLTVGTNLFGGAKTGELSGHLSFSQFRENSFIFSKIALFF